MSRELMREDEDGVPVSMVAVSVVDEGLRFVAVVVDSAQDGHTLRHISLFGPKRLGMTIGIHSFHLALLFRWVSSVFSLESDQ